MEHRRAVVDQVKLVSRRGMAIEGQDLLGLTLRDEIAPHQEGDHPGKILPLERGVRLAGAGRLVGVEAMIDPIPVLRRAREVDRRRGELLPTGEPNGSKDNDGENRG